MIDLETPSIKQTVTIEDDDDNSNRIAYRYEQLIAWGEAYWREQYPNVPYVILWADDGPASPLARQRVKVGRKLKRSARYTGYRTLSCPVAWQIHHSYKPGRKVLLQEGTGAFTFSFERVGKSFDILFVASHFNDSRWQTVEMAFVPVDQLEVWHEFEAICDRASNYLERSQKVYVIGSRQHAFEPKIAWENVILNETLKADLLTDLNGFFNQGVPIYRELGLPPFRKLLFVGPPGTGKSTLCVALAKVALEQRCVVIYVSSSEKECDDTNFDNVHRALQIAGTARFPVLLIIEDLDAYLMEKDEKSRILNVLDGIESPNNRHGVMLVATTNYPEIIDERITKRPGRVDRIFYIPPIEDEDQALRMLRRYMGAQWRDEHREVAHKLIGQTGVFVREIALYARILAANNNQPYVSVELLRQSVQRLQSQLATGSNLLPKRGVGFEATDSRSRESSFGVNRQA